MKKMLLLLVAGIIFSPNAYVMPSELCVGNGNIAFMNLRLRARVVYIDKNRAHQQKGDVYPENYTLLAENATKCMQTSELVTLFRNKGLGDDDYYLTNVRLDVKARPDCQLSGDESVHSWMGAPKTAKVTFKVIFRFFSFTCHQT